MPKLRLTNKKTAASDAAGAGGAEPPHAIQQQTVATGEVDKPAVPDVSNASRPLQQEQEQHFPSAPTRTHTGANHAVAASEGDVSSIANANGHGAPAASASVGTGSTTALGANGDAYNKPEAPAAAMNGSANPNVPTPSPAPTAQSQASGTKRKFRIKPGSQPEDTTPQYSVDAHARSSLNPSGLQQQPGPLQQPSAQANSRRFTGPRGPNGAPRQRGGTNGARSGGKPGFLGKGGDKFPNGGIADEKHQKQYRAPPGTPDPQKADVWKMCKALMDRLRKDRNRYRWFKEPVDTRAYPNYTLFVSNPMDFGTINDKLNNGAYNEPMEFVNDIDLVFDNCEAFNPAETEVGRAGKELRLKFEHWWKNMQFEWAIPKAGWRVEVRPDPPPLPKPDKHPNKGTKKKGRQEADERPDSPDIDEVVDPELEGDLDSKRKRHEANDDVNKRLPSKKKKKQADANADAEAAGGARPARATGKRPRLPDGTAEDAADSQRPDGKKKPPKQPKAQIDHPDQPRGQAQNSQQEQPQPPQQQAQQSQQFGQQQPPQQQMQQQAHPQPKPQPQLQQQPQPQPTLRGGGHQTMPAPGEGTSRDVPPGVRQNQVGKWLAEYRRGQFPRKWLGSFTYKEDAIRAYEERERELGHPSWRLGYGRIPGSSKKNTGGASGGQQQHHHHQHHHHPQQHLAMYHKPPRQKHHQYQQHQQSFNVPVSVEERLAMAHATSKLSQNYQYELMDICNNFLTQQADGEQLNLLAISDQVARRAMSFLGSVYPNWREEHMPMQQQQQQYQQHHQQQQQQGHQPLGHQNYAAGADDDDSSSSSSSDYDEDDADNDDSSGGGGNVITGTQSGHMSAPTLPQPPAGEAEEQNAQNQFVPPQSAPAMPATVEDNAVPQQSAVLPGQQQEKHPQSHVQQQQQAEGTAHDESSSSDSDSDSD